LILPVYVTLLIWKDKIHLLKWGGREHSRLPMRLLPQSEGIPGFPLVDAAWRRPGRASYNAAAFGKPPFLGLQG
jgi:hypothetical protein